jgi:hypothetical protein
VLECGNDEEVWNCGEGVGTRKCGDVTISDVIMWRRREDVVTWKYCAKIVMW